MIQRPGRETISEILDRVLDKGIVIGWWGRVSLVGIDLVTASTHVVVTSFDTYRRYASELNEAAPMLAPSVEDRTGGSRGAGHRATVRIVRAAFDAWNGCEVDRYAALLDDGYSSETHRGSPPLRGREAARHAMKASFQVFPDLHFTIERALAAGDDVIVSWLATGTPRDEYSGAPLTARPLQVPGCTVTRLRDGKIAHTWNYWDTDEILGELRATAERGNDGPQADHRGPAAS
jgi:steroid delta-isomerase-like uncharacterized protein